MSGYAGQDRSSPHQTPRLASDRQIAFDAFQFMRDAALQDPEGVYADFLTLAPVEGWKLDKPLSLPSGQVPGYDDIVGTMWADLDSAVDFRAACGKLVEQALHIDNEGDGR